MNDRHEVLLAANEVDARGIWRRAGGRIHKGIRTDLGESAAGGAPLQSAGVTGFPRDHSPIERRTVGAQVEFGSIVRIAEKDIIPRRGREEEADQLVTEVLR